MDQLIRGIVKSNQPTQLKGAFLDKISTAVTRGSNGKKECDAVVQACLGILYPDIEARAEVDDCFVNDRVEGVLTTWVQHHMGNASSKKRLRIGDVVVMKTLPPNPWRLGRVEALVGPGKKLPKGATLVARSNGALVTRPLQEIIPLGLIVSETNERVTKTSGNTQTKQQKVPKKDDQGQKHDSTATGTSSKDVKLPATEPSNISVESSIEHSSKPNTELNSELNSHPAVQLSNSEESSSTELTIIPSIDSVEPTVEPTEQSTTRSRKRRGSAVNGEAIRRARRKRK